MSLFITNNRGLLRRPAGRDIYSQPTLSDPIAVKCAVVHLIDQAATTSVRTDQSGTRGASEEETATAVILFSPATAVRVNDRFEIADLSLRVLKVEKRFDVFGKHNHDEATLGLSQ